MCVWVVMCRQPTETSNETIQQPVMWSGVVTHKWDYADIVLGTWHGGIGLSPGDFRYEAKCVQRRCFQCGSVPLRSDIKGTGLSRRSVTLICGALEEHLLTYLLTYPLPIYWYHSKGNWWRYNLASESFYIIKLCSRLFVLYCRNCPKDDKFR